jgi:hypothetical protein
MPCGQCANYDPRLGPKYKDTKRGNCIARAKYPHKEGPGQVFPPNAKRVAKGQLAEPFLVKKDQVVASCEFAKATIIEDAAEAKRKAVLKSMEDEQGNRVLR